MKMKVLLALALMSLSGLAQAENGCPAGYQPWRIPIQSADDCVPIPNYGNESTPAQPQARWATRWGAIAVDNANAEIGAVVGMPSKRQAKKAALKQCGEKKKGKCQVELTYYNQCAVVITADNGHNMSGAATVEAATRAGLQTCISSGDTNCRVYYSACSPPVRIR